MVEHGEIEKLPPYRAALQEGQDERDLRESWCSSGKRGGEQSARPAGFAAGRSIGVRPVAFENRGAVVGFNRSERICDLIRTRHILIN